MINSSYFNSQSGAFVYKPNVFLNPNIVHLTRLKGKAVTLKNGSGNHYFMAIGSGWCGGFYHNPSGYRSNQSRNQSGIVEKENFFYDVENKLTIIK